MSVIGVDFAPYLLVNRAVLFNDIGEGRGFHGHKGRPGQRGGSAPREGGDVSAPAAPSSSAIQTAVSAAASHGSQHEGSGEHAGEHASSHVGGHGGHEEGEESSGGGTLAKIAGIRNEIGHLGGFWHGIQEALFKGGHEAVKAGARGGIGEEVARHGMLGGHEAAGHEAIGHEALGHEAAGHEMLGGEHGGEAAGGEHAQTGLLGKANIILSAAGGIIGGKIGEGMEKAMGLDKAYEHLYQKMKAEHGEEEARTLSLGAKVVGLGVKTALGVALAHMGLGFTAKAALTGAAAGMSMAGKSRSKLTKALRTGSAMAIASGAMGVFGEHVAEAATEGLTELTSFSIPGVAYVSLLASHMLGKAYDAFHNWADVHFPATLRPSHVTGPAARLHRYVAHSPLGKAAEKLIHGVHEHLEHMTGLDIRGEIHLAKEHGEVLGHGLKRFAQAAGSKAKGAARAVGSKFVRRATANSVIGGYLWNADMPGSNPVDGSDLSVSNPAVQHYIGMMRDILQTLLSTAQGKQLWQELNTPAGAKAVMALLTKPDRHLQALTA